MHSQVLIFSPYHQFIFLRVWNMNLKTEVHSPGTMNSINAPPGMEIGVGRVARRVIKNHFYECTSSAQSLLYLVSIVLERFLFWLPDFILAGSNDCNCKNKTNTKFVEGILNKLVNVNNKTNLHVLNVLNRYDCDMCSFLVSEYNSCLSNICEKNNFDCINIQRRFQRKNFTRHGLHLNTSGKRKLVAIIMNSINPKYKKVSFLLPREPPVRLM